MKRFTGLFLALLLALGPTLAAAAVTTTGAGKVAAAGPPPGGLTFISHTTIELAAGAQTYSWTCGSCAAGDILIIQTTNNGPGIAWNIDGASSRNVPELGTPPYTDTSGNFNYDVYYTVLTANDISTHTITSNSNPLVGYYTQVAIYRGGSTVTFKSFATAAGSNTNTWAGFSPSGGSVGVIVMSSEYPYNIANVVSGARDMDLRRPK